MTWKSFILHSITTLYIGAWWMSRILIDHFLCFNGHYSFPYYIHHFVLNILLCLLSLNWCVPRFSALFFSKKSSKSGLYFRHTVKLHYGHKWFITLCPKCFIDQLSIQRYQIEVANTCFFFWKDKDQDYLAFLTYFELS